jgi:hypothetical protein
VHEGELPGVIELQTGDALAGGEHRGFRETPKLAAVHKGLEDVLLDVEIRIDNTGEPLAYRGEMLDGFADTVVAHVVGRGLRAEQQVVADVLLDEAVAVVAADDGVRQMEVVDARCSLP